MLTGLRETGTEHQTETDISSKIIPTINGTFFRGLIIEQRLQTFTKPKKEKIFNRGGLWFSVWL